MLGVENLIKYLDFGFAWSKQTAEILEDKKVNLLELRKYLDEVLMIPEIARKWTDVRAEIKDGLDDADRTRLYSHFQQKFDIPDDELEAWIEDAVMFAFSGQRLVERWIELRKRQKDATN